MHTHTHTSARTHTWDI